MKAHLLLVVLLFTAFGSSAQTKHNRSFMGCHHVRQFEAFDGAKKLNRKQQKALQTSIQRSDTIDIQHYDIHLDVTDYTGQYINGFTTITYSALEPDRESIILDLFELQVDSVLDGSGEQLAYNYDEEFLQVYFPESPVVGEANEMTVYYQGNPHQDPFWGGFYFQSDYIYNLGIGLTTVPPNFGKVWYPCFDIFTERAAYTYHITSANGMRASCQGDLIDEIFHEGDTLTRVYDFTQEIPTYLSAIAVADYVSTDFVHEGVYGEVPVRLTSKPQHQNAMNNVFQEVGFAIDACEYWYGPSPFSRVGYVLTTDGALEIPTNIAYPQFMLNQSLVDNGGLISHELGHYWWGDVITMIEHNDMWLKEGPAEYSSFLFVEFKDGPETFVEFIKDNQLFVLEQCHVQDNGFHPMSPMPDEEIYGRTTYQKGASVMHNLRAYMGDDLFRQGMMAMQENMPWSNMDSGMFRDSLELYTGLDLHDFFDDQVFSPGFSVFVIDSTQTVNNGGSFDHTLYLQQKLRECPQFYDNVPLEVTAYDANWQKHNFMVNASGQSDVVNITTDFMPVMVALNTNGKLNQARLDTDHTFDGTTGLLNHPWVDFRIGCNEINEGDSALVRIEHVWAAPDNDDLADYVDEISSTHYWRVDGDLPEGIELDGRLMYSGSDPDSDLDYDLVGFNENNIMLVWRPGAGHPWIKYTHYELQAGNTSNGAGAFMIEPLYPGEYAFANGDPDVAVAELNSAKALDAWPIPANEQLTIQWEASDAASLELMDSKGRLVEQLPLDAVSGQHTLSLDALAAGQYTLVLRNSAGRAIAHQQVIRSAAP